MTYDATERSVQSAAPVELYEFVRMAAIHLFEEMAPPEEQHQHENHAEIGTPTLH